LHITKGFSSFQFFIIQTIFFTSARTTLSYYQLHKQRDSIEKHGEWCRVKKVHPSHIHKSDMNLESYRLARKVETEMIRVAIVEDDPVWVSSCRSMCETPG
jgi:hypothetical protein